MHSAKTHGAGLVCHGNWLALVAIVVAGVVVPRECVGAQVAARAGNDSTPRRDTLVARLAPVRIHTSIAPTAGPAVGSRVPAMISTLDARRIEAWKPRTLPDALTSEAGISAYDDLGSPYKLNLSARGFNVGPTVGLPPGISVFLDGVRQNEPDAQEVNFDLLPMNEVERVEVLRDTASLLRPNSLGGAVNLITRRGGGPVRAQAEGSVGSFDAASGRLSMRGTADAWDYYAGGGYARQNGWRAVTGASSGNGFVHVGHDAEGHGVGLQAFLAHSRAETAGSIPQSLFATAPRTNFTAGDYEDLNGGQLSAHAYTDLRAGEGSLTLFIRQTTADRFNANQPPDDDVRGWTVNQSIGGTGDWRGSVPFARGVLEVRAGIDGAANAVDVQIFAVPRQSGVAGESLTTDVTSRSWDLAAYATADWRAGPLTLSGGARYDDVHVPFRDRLTGEPVTHNTYRGADPRVGISYAVTPLVSIFASAGRSFRAPAILELGCADPEASCPLPFALGDDPPLAPVRATSLELGGRSVFGPALLDASIYHTSVRDEIFFISSPGALLSGYFTNLPRTARVGAEASARVVLDDGRISTWANYAYTRATFETAATIFSVRGDEAFTGSPLFGNNHVVPGDQMPLVPRQQIKAGVDARLTHGASIGADWRLIGEQWLRGDEANETQPLSAYALANVRATIERNGWRAALIVRNLFDTHRATFGTFNENRETGGLERFLTPTTARSMMLVIGRRFGARDDGTP